MLIHKIIHVHRIKGKKLELVHHQDMEKLISNLKLALQIISHILAQEDKEWIQGKRLFHLHI